MAEKDAEGLCGLIDGELDDSEARFLVRRLGHDRELAARWGRYHLARSVVKNQARVNLIGFATRVSNALEADAPATGVYSPTWPGWLKPAAGMALAASVAVAVFSVWRSPSPETAAPPAGARALAAATVADPNLAGLARRASASQVLRPRLQNYVIRHNAAITQRSGQVLAPYRNLVSDPPPKPPADEEADSRQRSVGQ